MAVSERIGIFVQNLCAASSALSSFSSSSFSSFSSSFYLEDGKS